MTENIKEGCRSVDAKVLGPDIIVSEFDLQSRYYVHFRNNTLENIHIQVAIPLTSIDLK